MKSQDSETFSTVKLGFDLEPQIKRWLKVFKGDFLPQSELRVVYHFQRSDLFLFGLQGLAIFLFDFTVVIKNYKFIKKHI